MSREFIEKEVEKVLKNYPKPLNIAMAAAWILGNGKGQNLRILDVRKKSTLADYYVLASSTNINQSNAMADEISRVIKKNGFPVLSIEGRNSTDWILIDLGEVIIHVFTEYVRDIFNLEGLYKDAPQIEIPEEFYFATPESVPEEDDGGSFF